MTIQRKRVAKRLASGLLAGALALGGLAISGSSVSAKTPTSPTTNRISGADRYETATSIARALRGLNGAPNITGAIIASGETPYDALAAAVLSSPSKPILLVKKDSIPSSVADFLADYRSELAGSTSQIYIVGGTNAVSAEVEAAIKAAANTPGDTTPISYTRLSGADRYATAKAIADAPGVLQASDKLILVNGSDGKWADALSASVLSAKKGWPIVTTGDGGLNASAKATVDKYIALAGSALQFVLVGGESVLPTSIVSYIDANVLSIAGIRRVAGADRYNTSQAMNIYMVEENTFGAPTANGGKSVALVSGESPWDALASAAWAAAADVHVQLTTGASLSPFAGALAAVLTTLDLPANLFVIGGRNAVSEATRLAFIATSTSSNMATGPTLSGCDIGSTTLTVTFPSKLSTGENGVFTTAAGAALFLKNTTALGVTPAVSANPLHPSRTIYNLTVPAMVKGDVFLFAGFSEPTFGRSVPAATCTVAADTAAPTFTLRSVTTSGSAYFDLTVSEPIKTAELIGATTPLSWTNGGSFAATVSAVQPLDSAGLSYRLTVTASGHGLQFTNASAAASVSATGVVVTLSKNAIVDRAGNKALDDQTAEIKADAVAPTVSVLASTCTATADASTTNGFTVTYGASAGGTYYNGAKGNAWKLIVVSKRGLLIPEIKVDSAAKTMTVTADTFYHTADEVVTTAQNLGLAGLLGDWEFSGTTGVITPTTAAGQSFSGGTSTCYIALSSSENGGINATAPSITTAGIALAAGVNVTSIAQQQSPSEGRSLLVVLTGTKLSGTTVLSYGATAVKDLAGNAKALTVSVEL